MPPKSQSTISPAAITRSPASWCGLAAFGPAATMAKLTLSWPSASSRAEMSADTSASVRPTSSISPAWSWSGDPVGGRTGRAQRIDLGGVLHHPQRADDVDGAAERGARQLREQLDEEAGPHLVADGDGRRPPGELGGEGGRILGLVPDAQREHARLLDDPGASSRGTSSVASASRGTTSMVSRSSGIAS